MTKQKELLITDTKQLMRFHHIIKVMIFVNYLFWPGTLKLIFEKYNWGVKN